MTLPSLSDLQPYFSAIAALLSIATLGFVINLAKLIQEAAKERATILEERIKSLEDDLARTEKWSEREKNAVSAENEKLKEQLQGLLEDSGVTLKELTIGSSFQKIQNSLLDAVQELVRKMEDAELITGSLTNPEWNLELAKGYMATRDWVKAAEHLDKYIKSNPLDFEAQIARGVAYANSRGGYDSDRNALRAYSEAIAVMPTDTDNNMLARLYAYRGAMLKRLSRLDEAEAELNFAKMRATRDYEICDVNYNLAGVYALKGNRQQLIQIIREMDGCHLQLEAIRFHLHDYFRKYSDDKEFIALIGTL